MTGTKFPQPAYSLLVTGISRIWIERKFKYKNSHISNFFCSFFLSAHIKTIFEIADILLSLHHDVCAQKIQLFVTNLDNIFVFLHVPFQILISLTGLLWESHNFFDLFSFIKVLYILNYPRIVLESPYLIGHVTQIELSRGYTMENTVNLESR